MYSTGFSGICAPSIALHALTKALVFGPVVPDMIPKLVYLYAIEHNHECQQELRTLPTPPHCIFGDYDSFLAPGVLHKCERAADIHALQRILFADGAVTLSASCGCHSGCSTCQVQRAWLHISGLPCVDFSPQGKRRALSGPSMRSILIWARHRTLLKELVLIVEEVPGFDFALIVGLLPMYAMHRCVVNSKDVGLPVSRARLFMVFVLKGCCTLPGGLDTLVNTFRRPRDSAFTMYDLFIAPPDELAMELDWGMKRRAKLLEQNKQLASDDAPEEANTFYSALVMWERDSLAAYIARFGPHKVYGLLQTGFRKEGCGGISSVPTLTTMQCIIKHAHLLWVHKLERWLSGRELLLCQGIPTYDVVLREMQPWVPLHRAPHALSSFNRTRSSAGLPPRQRREFSAFAGNTMCVPVIGAVILYTLMHVEYDSDCGTPVPLPCLDVHQPIAASPSHVAQAEPIAAASPSHVEQTELIPIAAQPSHVEQPELIPISDVAVPCSPCARNSSVAERDTPSTASDFFNSVSSRRSRSRLHSGSSPPRKFMRAMSVSSHSADDVSVYPLSTNDTDTFRSDYFSESVNSQDHVSVGASGTHELAQSAGLSQVGVGAATTAAMPGKGPV